MPTFKVESKFHSDPKVLAAGPAAAGLWVVAGSWSAAHLTFGFVPDVALPELSPRAVELARVLVRHGLWVRVRGGYDFADDPGWYIQREVWRRRIPGELRQRVYERDGYCCLHCGTTEDLSLDHIVPWSAGGPDTYENLQTLCRVCNSIKGART